MEVILWPSLIAWVFMIVIIGWRQILGLGV